MPVAKRTSQVITVRAAVMEKEVATFREVKDKTGAKEAKENQNVQRFIQHNIGAMLIIFSLPQNKRHNLLSVQAKLFSR